MSEQQMKADISDAIVKSMGITSDMLSASRDGADDGQRISGRRKERASKWKRYTEYR